MTAAVVMTLENVDDDDDLCEWSRSLVMTTKMMTIEDGTDDGDDGDFDGDDD
jgi:hypothetical protein